MSHSLIELIQLEDAEPRYDIATCSSCDWSGLASECGTEKEGDWESGYYYIHTCPKCPDGGCIDDYDMSPEQAKKWEDWNKKKTGV